MAGEGSALREIIHGGARGFGVPSQAGGLQPPRSTRRASSASTGGEKR
jgi:hypothetical protein